MMPTTIRKEKTPIHLGDNRLEPGSAQIQENPQGMYITYTANTNLTEHLVQLVQGTQPYTAPRDDIEETFAFAVKFDQADEDDDDGVGVALRKSWWWNDDWGYEGVDKEYDIKGLVFTTNGAMDTWRNISPVFKARLAANAGVAKRRNEEFATHFDGETLAIFPLTHSAYKAVSGFDGRGVVMKALRATFTTCAAILPDGSSTESD